MCKRTEPTKRQGAPDKPKRLVKNRLTLRTPRLRSGNDDGFAFRLERHGQSARLRQKTRVVRLNRVCVRSRAALAAQQFGNVLRQARIVACRGYAEAHGFALTDRVNYQRAAARDRMLGDDQ